MYYIKFYDQNGKWFSTAWIHAQHLSDYTIAKMIRDEVLANINHWENPVDWHVFHNNQSVQDWYLSVLNEGLNNG